MIKRFLPAVLVLCLVFSLFTACGKKKTQKDDAQSIADQVEKLPVELDDDTKELLEGIEDIDTGSTAPSATQPNIKVTAELPEGWSEKTDNPSSIAYYERETNLVQVMAGWAPSEVKNTKGLAEYEIEQIKEYFEEATYSDIESYKLSGHDGSRMSIDIPITDTMKQTQVYVYLDINGKYYKIMGAYFSDDEQGKLDVEALIASLKIE